MTLAIENRRAEILHRIMAKCAQDAQTGCLVWQGPDSGKGRGGGYPRMWLAGQVVAVHRVVATHHFGFIPAAQQVDHTCKNRLCLNWNHFDLVTNKENNRRRCGHAPRLLRKVK